MYKISHNHNHTDTSKSYESNCRSSRAVPVSEAPAALTAILTCPPPLPPGQRLPLPCSVGWYCFRLYSFTWALSLGQNRKGLRAVYSNLDSRNASLAGSKICHSLSLWCHTYQSLIFGFKPSCVRLLICQIRVLSLKGPLVKTKYFFLGSATSPRKTHIHIFDRPLSPPSIPLQESHSQAGLANIWVNLP